MRKRFAWRSLPLLGVAMWMVVAGPLPTPTSDAQQNREVEQARLEPTLVEVGRLKFLSSSADVGSLIRHPDGTSRLWTYHPVTRHLTFFDPGLGTRLWQSVVPADVNLMGSFEPIIVAGGNLFLFSTREKVVAFSGTTGEYRWTFTNDAPNRPFEIMAANAVHDRVLIFRVRVDEARGPFAVELRAINAQTGELAWQYNDPQSVGVPAVWRQFVSISVPDQTGEIRTNLHDIRTGAVNYTCDFLPNGVTDTNLMTARFRSGDVRSRFILPDAAGNLKEVKFEWDPAAKMTDDRPLLNVPSVEANLISALWVGESNPNFQRHTFLLSEYGTTVKARLLDVPLDVHILQARVVYGGRVLAVVYRDGQRQFGITAVDLQTGRRTFDYLLNRLVPERPEPDPWPMFGIRYQLCDAGRYIGLQIDMREPQVTTVRLVDPMTGAASRPKMAQANQLPMNLTGGEFGWVENDDLVVCSAGRNGNLTTEPAEGDLVPMAHVVRNAQRWLISQQQRSGAFLGQQVLPLFGEAHFLTDEPQEDLATTALAGLALTVQASDEFDEFGIRRRGAMRRAVHFVTQHQNNTGRFQQGHSTFVDHCLALEFLIRALPADMKDTTERHRRAVVAGLQHTIRSRDHRGGFLYGFRLPRSFRLPQAPDLDGVAIQRELVRHDAGDGLTICLAHRVFRAAAAHPTVRSLVAGEMEKNVRWVTQVAVRDQRIFGEMRNMALILGGLGAELPENQRPSADTMRAIFEALPRPMRVGQRGRITAAWWYLAPDLPDLIRRLGYDETASLQTSLKQWLSASRYPDGQHAGTLGNVQSTALATLAAAALDATP